MLAFTVCITITENLCASTLPLKIGKQYIHSKIYIQVDAMEKGQAVWPSAYVSYPGVDCICGLQLE